MEPELVSGFRVPRVIFNSEFRWVGVVSGLPVFLSSLLCKAEHQARPLPHILSPVIWSFDSSPCLSVQGPTHP